MNSSLTSQYSSTKCRYMYSLPYHPMAITYAPGNRLNKRGIQYRQPIVSQPNSEKQDTILILSRFLGFGLWFSLYTLNIILESFNSSFMIFLVLSGFALNIASGISSNHLHYNNYFPEPQRRILLGRGIRFVLSPEPKLYHLQQT